MKPTEWNMDRETILAAVEERIRAIPGVMDMRFLDPSLKEEVTNLEVQAEKNGACGGLMPFVNRGVWEALGREVSLVIIGDTNLLVDNRGLLYMMDQKGQIMGEYVTPQQREKILKEKPETKFLSEDFILHPEVEIYGEPYFLIDEISFDYLEGLKGIMRVTSGSVSTMSDDYIRGLLGFSGPNKWTHLIGFDLMR
ncbi:MAG: hypothetical protein JET69_01470 [Methanomassiliicoccales archaeon]|nr:hypothetical protein [Methanomassiliicoccales archaeon]